MKKLLLFFFSIISIYSNSQSLNEYRLYGNQQISDSMGIFTDDGGANNDYSYGIYTKKITFTSKNGGRLRFYFDKFKTVEEEIVITLWLYGFPFDYHTGNYYGHELQIYDGPSSSSPQIGVFMGNSIPDSITSSCNSITFVFTTEVSQMYNVLNYDVESLFDKEEGWEAEFVELPKHPLWGKTNSICNNTADIEWENDNKCNNSYTLIYDINSNFSNPTVVSAGSVTKYSLNNLLPQQNYYWKIKNGNNSWSNIFNFKTQGAPQNVSVSNVCINSALINWDIVCINNTQEKYTLRYSKSPSFSAYKDTILTKNNCSLKDLDASTAYFYKIIVGSTASNVFSFNTQNQIPQKHELKAYNTECPRVYQGYLNIAVEVINSCTSSNSKYTVIISTDSSFASQNTFTSYSNKININNYVRFDKTYYFKVSINNGAYSVPIKYIYNTIITADNIKKITPFTNGAEIEANLGCLIKSRTYQFGCGGGYCDNYYDDRIWVAEDSLFNKIVYTNYDAKQDEIITGLMPDKHYFYRFRKEYGSSVLDLSKTFKFKTLPLISTSTSNLLCNNKMDISWPQTGYDFLSIYIASNKPLKYSYKFYLGTDSTLSNIIATFIKDTNHIELSSNLIAGKTYFYKIALYDWKNNKEILNTSSKTFSFTLPSDIPILATPTDNEIICGNDSVLVNFNWLNNNPVCPAVYKLQYSTSINFPTNNQTQTFNNITKSQIDLKLKTGKRYWWRVQQLNSTSWSTQRSVEVISPQPSSLLLSSPYDGINIVEYDSTLINFGWTSQTCVNNSSYLLQYSTDSLFTNPININTSATSIYKKVISNKKYYWRVRENIGANIGSWSTMWKFSTYPENVTMSNGTFIMPNCWIKFYDNGGTSSNYSNSFNKTLTIKSPNNEKLKVVFKKFETYNSSDYLLIYDGAVINTNAYIGKYYGATIPASFASSTNSLTFKFVSNSSNTKIGWEADVTCSEFKTMELVATTSYEEILLPSDSDIITYPNPSKENITVNFYASLAGKAEIVLINQLGQEVLKQQCNINAEINEIIINISTLNTGVYFLFIKSENQVLSTKIIKN